MSNEGPVKGIMLAERPKANTSSPTSFMPPSGTATNDPWGLTPLKKVTVAEVREKPPGINVHHRQWVKEFDQTMRDHREEALQAAQQAKEQEQAISQFSEKLRTAILKGHDVSFWKHARKASRSAEGGEAGSGSESNTGSGKAGTSGTASQPAITAPTDEEIRKFVDEVYQEAVALSPSKPSAPTKAPVGPSAGSTKPPGSAKEEPTDAPEQAGSAGAAATDRSGKPGSSTGSKSRPGTSSKTSKATSKPAWALSAAEVEEVAAEEEAELLDFAQGLDFDTFLDELDDKEMEGALAALGDAETAQKQGDDKGWRRNFVRAMNHVALKRAQAAAVRAHAGDDDGASVVALSEGGASNVTKSTLASRSKAEAAASKLASLAGGDDRGGKGWDASTKAGDDVASMAGASRAADEFLRENPDMKGVHSIQSVRAQLAKQEDKAQP